MKTIGKYAILLLAALTLSATARAMRSSEFTREVRKEFTVAKDARLVLDNKYGDIQCTHWDKDAVSVTVKITVNTKNQETANEAFEKIDIQMAGTASLVEVRTIFKEKLNIKGGFSIDYLVNMPAWINLDVTNKFGNVILTELTGKAKIDISYGDADIQKLDNSDNLINMKFGTARIDWIKGAVMNLNYSNFEGSYAGSLKLTSKYSNFSSGQVIALDMFFEGGEMNLEQTSMMTSKVKFAEIQIETLDQKLDLDCQYGSFSIERIPAGFTSLVIRNGFANIEAGIDSDASYAIDAEMHFCNLDYDENSISVEYRNDSGHDLVLKGAIGNNPKGLVKITSNYGNVSLQP